MLYLPGIGESAISISSDPGDSRLLHTIRIAGNVTRALAQKTGRRPDRPAGSVRLELADGGVQGAVTW